MKRSRLENLSDGVFAVALTLLVVDLRLPPSDLAHGFAAYFEKRWPSYIGFALTFLIISMIWVRHHWTFRQLREVDRPLIGLNVLLLALVVFLPFPAATLASFLRADAPDRHLAVATYGLVLVGIAVVLAVMWLWASRHRELLVDPVAPRRTRRSSLRIFVTPILYLAGLAISFVSVAAGLVVYAVVALGTLWQADIAAGLATRSPDGPPAAARGVEVAAPAPGVEVAAPVTPDLD